MAVWMDLISERISNRLIVLGLLLGLVRDLLISGWFGIIEFLLDMILPVIVLFLLYRFRALGAGDIKLFSLLGVWIGLKDLWYVVLYSLFFGAAMGLPKLLTGRVRPSGEGSAGFRTTRIHFSLAIGLGFLLRMGVKLCERSGWLSE